MWHRIIVLSFLAGVCLAQQTTSDKDAPRKYWRNISFGEVFVDVKGSRPTFVFPQEVYFSPMYRWPNQQVADIDPPIKARFLMSLGVGVNVHPLPFPFLNNILCGVTISPRFPDKNDFRTGPFLSRARFANGENAFTYARMSAFSAPQTFRAGYSIPLGVEEGEGFELEIGPQYSFYRKVEITQGYDTWDQDVVYRVSSGKGQARGGYAVFKIGLREENGVWFRVRFGVEYERGSLSFPAFPGKRPFGTFSFTIFGFEFGR